MERQCEDFSAKEEIRNNTVPEEQTDNLVNNNRSPATTSMARSGGVNTPIEITEVTTTRTILIPEGTDLPGSAVAKLVAEFETRPLLSPPQGSSSSAVLGDDVYYISDDEGQEPNATQGPPLFKHFTERSSGQSHSYRSPQKNGGWSPPRSSSPPSSSSKSKSTNPTNKPAQDILSPLGSFSEVDLTSDVSKMIKMYAKNSVNPNKHGASSRMTVKVRRIYKKDGMLPKIFQGLSGGGGSVTKSDPKTKKRGHGKKPSTGNDLSMLLWFKTSPDSIKFLAAEKDSCTAFYDRLSRALPQPVEKLKENWRQTVLLCKISLGNGYKSPHGYSHWQKSSHAPKGFDSVKGVGKFKPNWARNVQLKSTIVPIGETEKSTRFPSFEIDFNEYLVFNSHQIKVKYAVDIELVAKKENKNH